MSAERCGLQQQSGLLSYVIHRLLRDGNSPDIEIGVRIHKSNTLAGDPQAFERQVEEAYVETKMMLERGFAEAEPKFITYQNHLEVVVLEFYGNCDLLNDGDTNRMLTEIDLSALVDEVWVCAAGVDLLRGMTRFATSVCVEYKCERNNLPVGNRLLLVPGQKR